MYMKKKWFTLLEIIIATTLFFIIMVAILSAYRWILKFKYIFQAKANILETTYYMMEKVNVLLKDYTIDYDEYFNRSRVGCNSWYQANFTWNVWVTGHCDNFTFYGNGNSYVAWWLSWYALYYCSSAAGYYQNGQYVINTVVPSYTWCLSTWYQSFGQYAYQFYNMKKDADRDWSVVGDSDDTDLGQWPTAIPNSTWVQELYLISPDRKNRVLIRRSLISSWDWDKNGVVSGENEYRYTLQILKLKWFDAGNNHNFDPATSSWVYDGKIDTWACDYSQWFICNWSSIGNLYSWYHLPLNGDDGRVNLFDKNITVAGRNLSVYPDENPDFAWWDESLQINPYFTIFLRTKLYGELRFPRLTDSLPNFEFSLETTFDTKDNYTKQ